MDLAAARPAVLEAVDRFTGLVSSVDPGLQLPDSDWSVSDVAAHLVIVAGSYLAYLSGSREPVLDIADVPGTNALRLGEKTEREVDTLTTELDAATASFLDQTANADAGDPMFWHGMDTTVGAVYGIYLGELLEHGSEVARAARRRWPIDRSVATMIFEGVAAIAHRFLDDDVVRCLRATYAVGLRGGPSFAFTFADGGLTVQPGRPGRSDCRISADPRAVVLVVYGRSSQWAQIAQGRLLAYGRKPWLALRFAGAFRSV